MELKGLNEVVDFIRNHEDFTIVSHYDADGLSSAGIGGLMLKRLGKKFTIHISKSLEPERLEAIKELNKNFIFTDLGSGSVSLLENVFSDKKFAIIDHHEIEKKGNIPHFNPHLSGIDGAVEISGAGCMYLVAKEFGDNEDLSKMAVVGAVGDMQDRTHGELYGLNKKIVEDGINAGEIETRQDIRLFGRHSRPLIQFLSFCTDPFLPGLTANEEASKKFILDLGIDLMRNDKWRFYCDLDENEKKRFVSAIYVYGKEHNIPEFVLRNLVGEVYELKKETDRTEVKDAKEFATLLNACGRHEKSELGVGVCMGDRNEKFDQARNVLKIHRRMLRDGIEIAQKKGVVSLRNIYVLDAEGKIKDTIIGTIAGMLYGTSTIKNDKPIIAITTDERGKLKISARATADLVRRGLDLGKALKEATRYVDGVAGGHNIAAGGTIEVGKENEFFEKLDEIVGKQIH